MKGQINGLNIKESKEFVEGIRNIGEVDCNYWVQESFIEYKPIFTPIVISFGVGVASGVIANFIYNFLKNKKDEGKKVSISIGSINIYQRDTINIIEDKINKINDKGETEENEKEEN